MGSSIASGECQAFYNISEEEASLLLFNSADTVIIPIIIPILLCLGVTTNFTFLFVLFRVPKMRSEIYIYLMHLAIADLLFLILGATYDVWRYTASSVNYHVPFGNSAGCISFYIIVNTGYYASLALVTAVSFERFLAICHPMKHLKIRGKRRTNKLVAICWLVGLIFAGSTVPYFANLTVECLQWPEGDKYHGLPSTVAFCTAVQPWVDYYAHLLRYVPWLITMVASIYMYVRILKIMKNRNGIHDNSKTNKKAHRTQNQVAKMLIVNGVVFFVCQTPYRVYSLFEWICLLAQIRYPLWEALGNAGLMVLYILQYINTAVNPLIYGAVNAQYRAAFIEAFHFKVRLTTNGPTKPSFALRAAENRNTTAHTPTDNENTETRL